MPKKSVILTLAKVIVAAAWADGEVSHDEINSLKDLLFRLRDLTARDWAELEIYIDNPIDAPERNRLVSDLQAVLVSQKEKDMALAALEEMIQADGQVTEQERVIAGDIKAAIEATNVGLLGLIGKLIQGPLQRRGQAITDAPNRELYLEDYLRNRIFYQVRRRLKLGEAEIDLPEEEMRTLSLAGGLLARVAHVDHEVTAAEFAAIVAALQEGWGLTQEASAFVAEVAVTALSAGLDFYRLTRDFFTSTTEAERLHFLDALFAVAASDGKVTHQETEEIRTIARGLKLTHKQFINSKLSASN
jgi:uncharacterized tellurite resistance protein B-like protein